MLRAHSFVFHRQDGLIHALVKFSVKSRTLLGFVEPGTWGKDPELEEMILFLP